VFRGFNPPSPPDVNIVLLNTMKDVPFYAIIPTRLQLSDSGVMKCYMYIQMS